MKYHRKDRIHDGVIEGLRADGLSCTSTSSAGGGFPDVVIGAPGITIVGDDAAIQHVRAALRQAVESGSLPPVVIHTGANLIVELKSGTTGDRKTKTPTRERQEKWAAGWRGQKSKCLSTEEVYALVGRQPKKETPECPSLPPCQEAQNNLRRRRRVARR
jgi:hypothetical protein